MLLFIFRVRLKTEFRTPGLMEGLRRGLETEQKVRIVIDRCETGRLWRDGQGPNYSN